MKKILLSLLSVFAVAVSTQAADQKTFQLCTEESEILNPDNKFLVVTKSAYNGAIYALDKTGTAGTVILNESSAPESFTITNATNYGYVSIEANGTYKIPHIYKVDEEGNYTSVGYFVVGSKTTLNVSATIDTTTSGQYSVSLDTDDNTVSMIAQASSTRALFFSNGTSFKNYATSNATGTGYSMPLFYKEVNDGPQKPKYEGYNAEYSVELTKSIPLPNIMPDDLTYSFTTDDTDLISIDEDAKTITGLKEGTATVKFTTPAVEGSYLEGDGSFAVTVTKIMPIMSFRDEIVVGKLGVGVAWEPVNVEEPAEHGEITYTSSNPDIVTISEPNTGRILPEDVKAAGKVTITATLPADGDYAEGTASYEIEIIDPAAHIDPAFVVFDFSVENPYGFTTTNNSGTYEKEKEIISENGMVTITFAGQYRSWNNSGSYELRLNKGVGNKMTFDVPEGYKISKIGLVATSNTNGNADGTFTPASGTISGSNDELGVNPTTTWIPGTDYPTVIEKEGEEDKNDYSVTYAAVNSGDKIKQIYVMYEPIGSDLKSADLSFDKVVNGIYVNEEGTVNAVNNPYNREIIYSIPNLADDEYVITTDGENIKVLVKVAGSYTLQATSVADETYRDGLAIMRLNVYNHLDVTVEGGTLSTNTEGVEEIDTEKAVIVRMTIPEFAYLYYQIVTSNTPETQADDEYDIDPDDENCIVGFEQSDGQIEIDAKTNGALNFYIANYGYISPIRTILLNDPTGSAISEVEAAGSAVYFDLQGRKVAAPARGIYVRTQGGKSTKVRI